MPLPAHRGEVDKDARGRVLAIGGCAEMPGALLLAGVAALRAGAGKLQLGTSASVAPMLALAIPESLVIALPESEGAICASAHERLDARIANADVLLLGPGLAACKETDKLARAILAAAHKPQQLVLDAAVLATLEASRSQLLARGECTVLTPHAGEMATMLGIDLAEVQADPAGTARRASERFGAIVALKGSNTFVAAPDGRLFRYGGGGVGLATSGSGDTLAGIVTGLIARGASPLEGTIWAVYVHGEAGKRLARRIGRVGFLARELLSEVPRAIAIVERS